MSQKPMDFNPLDILAAAALGEKDASSDVKSVKSGQKSSSGQESKADTDEDKDAEDDPDKEMGKTTSTTLKHKRAVAVKEKDMAPQKTSWSPESFLTTQLVDTDMKPEKFSLGDLVQDLKKVQECDNIFDKSSLKSLLVGDIEENNLVTTNKDIGINNNLVTVKNVANLALEILSKSQEIDSSPEEKLPIISQELSHDKCATEPDTQLESGSHSDTDTADSVDLKVAESTETSAMESLSLDHSYALIPGQTRPSACTDPFEDGDVDVCSQNSPLMEETEQRSRNLSLDCNYLKSGILEGESASPLDLYKISSSFGRSKLPSSSSSTSSPTHDPISKFGREDISDSNSCRTPPEVFSPDKFSPKYGKFRIGNYASFSSSNLELEKYLRNKDPANSRKLNIGIPADTSWINSSLSSPTGYSTVQPLLQSPSLDWDRSEAGSEVHDDSSDARTPHRLSPDFTVEKVTEWSHPMYHDHDYCAKDTESKSASDDSQKLLVTKRKYTRRRNKLESSVNHEKIMKAKYLKKELLRQDSFKKAPSEVELIPSESSVMKANPVGRPRKRPLEKNIEEEIDPETGTKMKITGKFQDQYVYYLSKSSRTTTRRRQAPVLPFPSDKIIVPAPKPGDIIVPHLTDADIETVRTKGRSALNLPERPHMNSGSIHVPTVPSSSHSNEFISDVDSHIVSTILSMESDNLASPSSSQSPDIPGTSDLIPNQPALTESLRIMSGDNSITSEHVLSYLLSVVKDEVPSDNLLGHGSGFDSSTSALFPTLPSDSIYSKVDHLEEPGPPVDSSQSSSTDLHSEDSKLADHTEGSVSVIHNAHTPEADHFAHTVSKDQVGDHINLPDLSSFMSNSQGTSSSSTTHDGDSHGSLKSMFGSDLSSLGTPQLSSSVPRLTSIEKTLDFLGVKDGDIKLDSNDAFIPKIHQDVSSTQLLTPDSVISSDDTPWIVTVTLYFNDVPAIMINSQPYIRLVDIHKQILPAKDTGILKKRCQLLKIPVLNCSEMQRYFLVQYGRAYNSKSTLIISKSQATELVTYYATPQPRTGRGEDAHVYRSGSRGSDSGGTMSPVTVHSPGTYKKKGHKLGKKAASVNGVSMPDAPDGSVRPQSQKDSGQEPATVPLLHSKRTRHKKVNYLEMLRGEEKEKSSDAAILETIESVVKASPDHVASNKSNKGKLHPNGKMSGNKKSKVTKRDKSSKFSSKKFDKSLKVSSDKFETAIQKIKGSKMKNSKTEKSVDRDCALNSDGDTYDASPYKSKFCPLKLKVNSLLNFAGQRKGSSPTKKGLFSRSNSSSSPTNDRVLAIAHQAALSGEISESHLPSQPADIHLDLFTKPSSPCVRCQTCCQFLSVQHFMRHHHVPMDNEWLATEAAQRILVPRNKENISELEKRLWEEFHTLQEAIGGFGEADDESDSDEDDFDEDDQSSLDMSGASSSLLSMGGSPTGAVTSERSLSSPQSSSSDAEDEEELESQSPPVSEEVISPAKLYTVEGRAQQLRNQTASRIGLVKRSPYYCGGSKPLLSNGLNKRKMFSGQRTSSRKRKSKQLFSIENYYKPTSKRASVDDQLDSLTDVLEDSYSHVTSRTNAVSSEPCTS